MCHHIETADHERVMELAAEWEEWQREQEGAAERDETVEEQSEPTVAPADD